ncbi:nitroreductase/quinone reductase family protein [Nocardia carnea]|uniref:Nitroreductase/quinone reductase family protein n=1 Tax=Nocardia carnea TaxID=37328 RepID=A0ABW7TDQ1_9NOCA|nr:nitroreductase/quinone reductase family protein [Nocardia carnea]
MSLPSDMPAFNRSVVEDFRAHDGEITMDGMLKGADLVLLTTVGRRSGRQHIVPLAYLTDGDDRIVLWASNMAAAEHPAWYRNLATNPQVIIERPTSAGIDLFTGTVHTATGAERERLFAMLADRFPHMAAHQQQTEREIPLVVVGRVSGLTE